MHEPRLRKGLEAVEKRYKVRLDDGVLARDGYLAGSDEQRAEALMRAFRDPDVRAVHLARGGYGLTRILHLLDAGDLRRDPKLVVGYSDATALLFWMWQELGLRSIHGPMVCHFGEIEAADQEWLFGLMEGTHGAGARVSGAGTRTGTGTREGVLLGGNLCLLSHLVGTKWQPEIDGILFFEEVGEQPYAIDRFLTHLRSAGMLDKTVATVVGQLTRCSERGNGTGPTAEQVVAERFTAFGIAAAGGFEFGHGETRNLALPFGARARVDFATGTLELLDSATA